MLKALQDNIDPDISDAWSHADQDEFSFGPTSSDENNKAEAVLPLVPFQNNIGLR